MIRLIIDKYGNGHDDLFLKIDLLPTRLIIADSYYLFDFLELTQKEVSPENTILSYGAAKLIDFWEERITSLKYGNSTIIPFGMWDEYVDGIIFKKVKLGYKISLFTTQQICGYEISKSNLETLVCRRDIVFSNPEKIEWLISGASLKKGFELSKSELSK